MNRKYLYWIECIAAGLICLFLFCAPLFWVRYFSDYILIAKLGEGLEHLGRITVQPSGLLPDGIENDPNVVQHSFIDSYIYRNPALTGFWQFYRDRMPKGRYSNIYDYWGGERRLLLKFDRRIGQINFIRNYPVRLFDGTIEHRRIQLYAGPEGMSEKPSAELGHFVEPVVDARNGYIYDKKQRRFFNVNFHKRTVTKGPVIDNGLKFQPVQIGEIEKNQNQHIHFNIQPPMIDVFEMVPDKDTEEELETRQLKSLVSLDYYNGGEYILVLDESGIIYLLDKESLSISGTAGRLPGCKTLYDSKTNVGPKDLLAYEVSPVTLWEDNKYRGMCAASLSRECTSMALAIYDEEGKLLKKVDSIMGRYVTSRGDRPVSSSKRIYFHTAWAPTLTIIKYLAENLHPPVLSILSYITADSFEAESGYRAMFVMPNSFIAMKGRKVGEGEVAKLIDAVIMILPSIILSVLLAWRVGRDAKIVGISEEGRMWWIAATVLFGVAGYITYRVVRYKERLVTCLNCGKMRRCDMETCHRCGAGWDVPELAQPQWRVIG